MMTRKDKWKKGNNRYVMYYNKMMLPIRMKQYQDYLKRIAVLKKRVLALGKVPEKEQQLISTVKYFVSLINLATEFEDKGYLTTVPSAKAELIREFNSDIASLVSRKEGNAQYWNKSEVGKKVTFDNLYLGMFSKIKPEEITPELVTTKIAGEVRKVECDYFTLSQWINGQARSLDGYGVKIKQQDLAAICKEVTKLLLHQIDKVLE